MLFRIHHSTCSDSASDYAYRLHCFHQAMPEKAFSLYKGPSAMGQCADSTLQILLSPSLFLFQSIHRNSFIPTAHVRHTAARASRTALNEQTAGPRARFSLSLRYFPASLSSLESQQDTLFHLPNGHRHHALQRAKSEQPILLVFRWPYPAASQDTFYCRP